MIAKIIFCASKRLSTNNTKKGAATLAATRERDEIEIEGDKEENQNGSATTTRRRKGQP